MQTWRELEQQFRALDADLRDHYIEYQWGGDADFIALRGTESPVMPRFEALAQLAGTKLTELPADQLPVEVLVQRSFTARWYEALRLRAGTFQAGEAVAQLDRRGIPRGAIHTGTMPDPATASAALAAAFSRFDPELATHGFHRPQRMIEAASMRVVPTIKPFRPWWRSWQVALVALAFLVALVVSILPETTRHEGTRAGASRRPTSGPDDGVIEIQQFTPSPDARPH